MAHFAEIGIDGKVLRVIVVDNKDTSNDEGVEQEEIGAAFCNRLFGGTWKQTSYNRNFRKNFAAQGFDFDGVRNAFISPKPYASWVLNEDTCRWGAPTAMPTDGGQYQWDEATTSWINSTFS
jgi:hypothetical protein